MMLRLAGKVEITDTSRQGLGVATTGANLHTQCYTTSL